MQEMLFFAQNWVCKACTTQHHTAGHIPSGKWIVITSIFIDNKYSASQGQGLEQ